MGKHLLMVTTASKGMLLNKRFGRWRAPEGTALGSNVGDLELYLFVVFEPLDLDVAAQLCVGQLPDFDDRLRVDRELFASHVDQLAERELGGQDVDLKQDAFLRTGRR